MKAKSKLKNLFLKTYVAIILMAASSGLIAQEQQSTDLKDFNIIIEKTESGIKMESLKGSAWINLSFSIGHDKPQAIDEYGMTKLDNVSPTKDSNLADFLFTIATTKNGIVLKGIEGTAWTELSISLTNNEKQKIDQFGMTN